MIAIDYDKKHPFYSMVNRKVEIQCKINHIDYNNYLGTFLMLVRTYREKGEKQNLWDWLDNVRDPYFFLLTNHYKYGAGISFGGYGYLKKPYTGFENMDIARQYAVDKIMEKIC